MNRVSLAGVDRTEADAAAGRYRLSEALGSTAVALNYYRVVPGEGLPGGLHAHADQEEVFVVLEGEATFETLEGEVGVSEGEAVRFAPGEFQSGRNGGEDELVVLALGAPRDSGDVRLPFACPDCGDGQLRLDADEGVLVCPECGGEHVPAPCPDCGAETLQATVGERGAPVAVCRECAATFDRPPLVE